ncbi:hypothetical protein D5R93_10505 [Actinomyces lilanjuaniae]|uniref:Uncharacterized protein n=1 Tax=Actinomyces lilanjuaniae TaxID=2321394 RepID=A0ABM6Z561_9ACTO|nr:VanW family protein [Actinomyces lilanjuaniae]AYD90326.1 hypothetical protein D5R93_10505 [Actinomyces lilanjuaniae]
MSQDAPGRDAVTSRSAEEEAGKDPEASQAVLPPPEALPDQGVQQREAGSQETATPAEAGPLAEVQAVAEGAAPAQEGDGSAGQVAWIQHADSSLPPSIAPAGRGEPPVPEDPAEPTESAGPVEPADLSQPAGEDDSAQTEPEQEPEQLERLGDAEVPGEAGPEVQVPADGHLDEDVAESAAQQEGLGGREEESDREETAASWYRRRLPALMAAGALVLLAWGGLSWWTTQHLHGTTTVAGVDVSGLSAEEARTRVASVLGEELAQPVTVTVGERQDQLVPADSGVSVDAQASVGQVTGMTLNPVTLVGRLRGTQVDAVVEVDRDVLNGALEDRVDALSSGTVSATVSLEGTQVVTTGSQTGTGLDVVASVDALVKDWPLGEPSIALAEGTAVPAITDAEATQFVEETLEPLLSSEVTVTVEGTEVEEQAVSPVVAISPETIAAYSTIGTSGGRLSLDLDPAGVREAVLAGLGPVETPAVDAGWIIDGTAEGAQDAAPRYVPASSGLGVDTEALLADLVAAGTSDPDSGSRMVTLPLTVLEPEVTLAEEDWGVAEPVGEYSTPYSAADIARTQNLETGAEKINSTSIPPGATFSLEEALGPVDYDHGFTDAGVISNGQHTDSMGGGLSQVATTVFNAGFEAGMDDTEHTAHQYYFDRYPAGREATLWTGVLDVKFTNSTPYGVMVQAWLDGEEIHVRLWSTAYYEVSITSSERYNYRPVTTETQSGPGCQAYSGGNPGFDITVTRRRAHDGQALPEDVLTTSYYPDNNVVCS